MLAVVLGCLTCVGGALAQVPATPQHIIPTREQAARDSDRVEILRQELKKSESLLEALTRRQAERPVAADAQGGDETEEERRRVLSDIAGLQRELALATRQAAPSPGGAAAAAVGTKGASASPLPRPAAAPSPAPWWDVYGKARRAEAPAAVPSPVSIAPAEAGPRLVSARRPE